MIPKLASRRASRAGSRPLRVVAIAALFLSTLVVPAVTSAASRDVGPESMVGQSDALADLDLTDVMAFALDPDGEDSIAAFWRTAFPDYFDGEYRDPLAIHPYISGPVPSTACALTVEDVIGNGVYCFEDESITIDLALLDFVSRGYGPAAAMAVLAHEWGHHIQGLTARPERDQRAELQADCYAGMYLAHLVDRSIIDGEDVLGSIGFIEFAGDEQTGPGSDLAWFDPERHGADYQRRQAHGIGYSTGDAAYCRAYDRWTYEPPIPLADASGSSVDAPLLNLPPGSNTRLTADGVRLTDMPGTEVTVVLTRVPAGEAPADVIADLVGPALGADTRVTGIVAGWLETPGWATSEGARARVERTSTDGSAAVGAAGLQVHGDGSAELFIVMSRSGEGEDAARALDALAWGYCDPLAAVTSNCGPTRSILPTPRPLALPTPRPVAVPRPTPRPDRRPSPRELRRDLRASVPWVSSCKAWTKSQVANDPFKAGSRAAILCEDPGPGIDYMALYRFDRARAKDRYWRGRLDKVVPAVPARRSACEDGRRGFRSWRYGSLACWISADSGLAALRWTDERTNTYGILHPKGGAWKRDLANLYRQWELLRP